MSGGLGSRTTTPKWDLILAALELGLQAWRTTASRDRFFDAIAELGHAREREARCVRAEEALRQFRLLLVDPLPSADVLVDELDRLAGVDKPA